MWRNLLPKYYLNQLGSTTIPFALISALGYVYQSLPFSSTVRMTKSSRPLTANASSEIWGQSTKGYSSTHALIISPALQKHSVRSSLRLPPLLKNTIGKRPIPSNLIDQSKRKEEYVYILPQRSLRGKSPLQPTL